MRLQVWQAIGLLGVHVGLLSAQPPTVLSGAASCEQCRIELEQILVFGDSTGPGMLQEQSRVATDQRGRFYVTSPYDPTIAVFDARGRFLRHIGRKGQGPGEFTGPPAMFFGPGDTLYAIDGTAGRMTVFSPEAEIVRTVTFAGSYYAPARLADGRFLFSGISRSAGGAGHPLHLFDQTGALVRSFGAEAAAGDGTGQGSTFRRIAAPLGPTVWTTRLTVLDLEQWSSEGKRLAHIIRRAPWFPKVPIPPPRATDGTHPSPPLIRSLSEDRAGLLWTLTLVPDHEWRPRTLPTHPAGGQYTPDSLQHKLVDSVLEVIDPRRRVVLATRTFDTAFMSFIAPDLLVSFTEDAAGNPRYIVWRVSLVDLSSRRDVLN